MTDPLVELQRQVAAHEHGQRPKPAEQKHFLGHGNNKSVYLILLLIILCIGLIIAHILIVEQLKKQQQQTLSQLAEVQAERDEYKTAYEGVLQDAQAFGKIFNITYHGENTTEPTHVANEDVKRLPIVNIWAYYEKQGLVNDSCISTTNVLATPDEIVVISILAGGGKATNWPQLTLLVDGTYITRYTINSTKTKPYATRVILSTGEHLIDLVDGNATSAGNITITALSVGDRTINTTAAIINAGAGFAMFNCKNVTEGDTLTTNSAMRFRVEKI